MGNKQSLNPAIPVFHAQQWQHMQSLSPQHPEYGDYKVFRHVQNGQLIDEYEMTFNDEEDYKNYLRSCIWRLRESQIVNTLFIKQQHKEEFCSTTYCIKVYLQHIDTRLSDITDIPYPENLYVALSSLDGFHKLHEQLDYFKIEENQICVDENGHVRVWVNSDLSKNYPSIDEDYHSGDQTLMVYQIMSIITENTDRDSQPQSLKDYFFDRGGDKIGFQDAQIIISEYARKHNAQIPQCFQSILQIYRKQQQSQENNEQVYTNDQQNNMNPNNSNQFPMVNRSYNDGLVHLASPPVNQSNSFNYYPPQQNSSQMFKPWKANQMLQQNQQIHSKNPHYNIVEQNRILQHNSSHKSIPNLHNFSNQNQRLNFHMENRIQQLQQHTNPLGFLPSYNPLPASPHQIHARIVQYPQHSPQNQSSIVRYFSPQQSPHHPYNKMPAHISMQKQNIAFQAEQHRQNSNIRIDQIADQELSDTKFSNRRQKKQSNPLIQVVPPISQQQGAQSIIDSRMQRSEKISSVKENRSNNNASLNQYDQRQDRQHITVSNAFSNDNSHQSRREAGRSRDIRIDQGARSLSNQNVYIQHREEFLRIPKNNGSTHNQDTDKTFYFTLDTEQQLDPEIAADLKKMFTDK